MVNFQPYSITTIFNVAYQWLFPVVQTVQSNTVNAVLLRDQIGVIFSNLNYQTLRSCKSVCKE